MLATRSARRAAATLVVAALAPGAPAAAATWTKPVLVGDERGLHSRVNLDSDGTARLLKVGDGSGPRAEVFVMRPGSAKPRRCRVPGLTADTDLVGPASGVSLLASNRSGAMAVAWNAATEGSQEVRVWAVSAAAGRCFGKPRAVSSAGRRSLFSWARMGAGGTALVYWEENVPGSDARALRYATARAGAAFGGARKLAPRGASGTPTDVAPQFLDRDRVLWSWATREPGVTRRWAATSAPRAGTIGRAVQVAEQRDEDREPSPIFAIRLTDPAGGQLALEPRSDGVTGQLHLWTRRAGRAFGARRTVAIPPYYDSYALGINMNRAGAAVIAIAAGQDIRALVRRRDGKLTALQALTTDGDHPVAAIDDAGRAVVAWAGGGIHAAVAGTGGTFGAPALVSGLSTGGFPAVVAGAGGRAVLAWEDSAGTGPDTVHLSRGRLDR